MSTISKTVLLLSAVIALVSCQGDKIWNPDEFAELISGGERGKYQIAGKLAIDPYGTNEDIINNRNVVNVGCFSGYVLVRGRCVEILN